LAQVVHSRGKRSKFKVKNDAEVRFGKLA